MRYKKYNKCIWLERLEEARKNREIKGFRYYSPEVHIYQTVTCQYKRWL